MMMLVNEAAARLLEGADQATLWDQASKAVAYRSERCIVLTLGDGRAVRARCRPIAVGPHSTGVLVELFPTRCRHRVP
jgi:hypothetical protein